jgi:hypothetical protein
VARADLPGPDVKSQHSLRRVSLLSLLSFSDTATIQSPCSSPSMALDIVSPLLTRVLAALAIARTLLVTVFKLLLLLVICTVLDTCSLEATLVSYVFSSISIFSTISPSGSLQARAPSCWPCPPKTSCVAGAAAQCVPSLLIQYCGLGTVIRCGAS